MTAGEFDGIWKQLGLPVAPRDPDLFWADVFRPHPPGALLLAFDFGLEHDLPLAHAEFCRAVEAARAATSPRWDPPAEFWPGISELARIQKWRNADRFPALARARGWLLAIRHRVT